MAGRAKVKKTRARFTRSRTGAIFFLSSKLDTAYRLRIGVDLITEINPEWYDVTGRKVFRPDFRRHSGFRPTFPVGRFLSQPLRHSCSDFAEMRRFLSRCQYVTDQEQFGQKEYWQPPEQFEEIRKGDCEDFALWAWRQVMQMKYQARFVAGISGQYREGHAWVTFEKDGKYFLLESLDWPFGLYRPRLSILRYKPRFSVSWDGERISYYEHEDKKFSCTPWQVISLCAGWLLFWAKFWPLLLLNIGRRLGRMLVGRKSQQKRGV